MSNGAARFLKDGAITLEGGQDSGRSPSVLARNQVAFATNTTFRGGFASPRPGIKKRPLTIPGDIDTAFKGGRFQHAAFYDGNGTPSLLTSIGGRQFRIDAHNYTVSEITPDGGNSPNLRLGWSVQAENYWIYQDNQSQPIIYDGSTARRSNPQNAEVPVGNVMAYAMGRLIVALRDNQSFRAGDLVFGKTGTTADLLEFTENDYLNEGGDFVARVFGAPSGYGPILAMKAIAMTDTQLGQGPLMIFTPNVVFTIQLPFDRTIWKNLSNALMTVNPIKGALSNLSVVNINNDLWYRSQDGIRSYLFAQRQFGQYGNTPMSTEVENVLNFDTPSLVQFASAVLFDNRLMTTASPVPSQHGVWHRGLVALDFDLVSSLGRSSNPAWEGLWTGVRILQLVSGTVDFNERCWMFVLNDNNEIELWEILPEAKFDNDTGRISWTVDFPAYNCGDAFQFKKLELAELFIDQLSGTLDITARYKPDQYPCWLPWDTTTVCAKNQDCTVPQNCGMPQIYEPQFRSKIRFHQPPDNFDTQNRRKHRTGYEFQPRLEMTGYCQIKQLRILALEEPEKFFAEEVQP